MKSDSHKRIRLPRKASMALGGLAVGTFVLAPNVANEVPSGKIVATAFLDVLTHIQAATFSSAEQRTLSNAWANTLTIEVPETGISIIRCFLLSRPSF